MSHVHISQSVVSTCIHVSFSHISTSHAHTCQSVMSNKVCPQVSMRLVTCWHESSHTHKKSCPHLSSSHATHVDEFFFQSLRKRKMHLLFTCTNSHKSKKQSRIFSETRPTFGYRRTQQVCGKLVLVSAWPLHPPPSKSPWETAHP